MDNGTSAQVTGYTGNSDIIFILARINRLPDTGIGIGAFSRNKFDTVRFFLPLAGFFIIFLFIGEKNVVLYIPLILPISENI